MDNTTVVGTVINVYDSFSNLGTRTARVNTRLNSAWAPYQSAVEAARGPSDGTYVRESLFGQEHDAYQTYTAAEDQEKGQEKGTRLVSGSFLNSDGSFTFTPTANFFGTDTFTYQASDPTGKYSTGTVSLQVDAPPIANGVSYTVTHDTTLDTAADGQPGLLANDSDPNGGVLGIVGNTDPGHGTVVVSADGNFVYTPTAGYVGSDSFSVTVGDGAAQATALVALSVTDQAPTMPSAQFTTDRNTPLLVESGQTLLSGASDLDGDLLQIVQVNGDPSKVDATFTLASGAQLTVNADGSFIYTPTAGFTGNDQFTFTASDGIATVTATATINVVEQAPVPQPASYAALNNQTLAVAAADGLLVNTPNPDQLVETVSQVNGNAALVGQQITLGSGGKLTVNADGSFDYIPAAAFTGVETCNFTLSDGLQSGTSTASFTVSAPALLALDQGPYATPVNTRLTIADVLANDTVADGVPLTIASSSAAMHGALALVDGVFVYDPATGYSGPDSFTYTVSDGTITSNTATVSIAVVRQAVWTGLGDGRLWSDPHNWSNNLLPDMYSNAIIGAGATVTLDASAGATTVNSLRCDGSLNVTGSLTLAADSRVAGTFAANGSLTLQGNMTLTLAGGGTIDGQVTLAANSVLALAAGTADPQKAFTLNQATVTGAGLLRNDNSALIAVGTSSIANSQMNGGTIDGAGTYAVGTAFSWTGGTLTDTGTLSVGVGAAMTIGTGSAKAINGHIIANSGQITWDSDETITSTGGSFDNLAGATFSILGDGTLQGPINLNNSGTLHNEGYAVLTLGTTTNTGIFDIAFGELDLGGTAFQNPGQVNVAAAKFVVATTGTAAGNFNITDATGSIEFAASYTLAATSSVTGLGAVAFTAGSTTIAGAYSAQTTSINNATATFNTNVSAANLLLGGSNGRLSGTGTFTVTAQMDWAQGTMDGGGSTVIASTAIASLISQDFHSAKAIGSSSSSRNFTNAGTMLWYGGQITLYSSTFLNTGTLKILGNNNFSSFGDSAVFNNSGIVDKQLDDALPPGNQDPSVPAFGPDIQNGGTSTLSVNFNNQTGGRLIVDIGSLDLYGGTNAGRITVSQNGVLWASWGQFQLNSGTQVDGTGTVGISTRGRLVLNTSVTMVNVFLNGGVILGTGNLTVTNQLEWTAGGMSGAGTTTITASGLLLINGNSTKSLSGRLISNFGSYETGGRSTFTRTDSNGVVQYYYETGSSADTLANVATNAMNTYIATIGAAQQGTLTAVEAAANTRYATAVNTLTDSYEAAVNTAETAYDTALTNAGGLDPSSSQYEDALTLAETARDNAITAAAATFTLSEQARYNEYLSSTSVGGVKQASDAYNAVVANAQAVFERAVRGTPGQGGLSGDINGAALYLHNLLRGIGPPATSPDQLHTPRVDSPSAFLAGLSAGSRAILAVAYFQRWHVELEADITATQWWHRTDIFTSLHGEAPTDGFVNNVNNMLTAVGTWTTSTVATIQTHAQDPVGTVTALASTVWDSTVQTVNQSVDLLRTDPLQFLSTAGQVWLNSQMVMANTLTFGLIPGLNTTSDNIVQSHGFYRGVQIAGILGREAALAFLTGGTGNAIGLGARGLTLAARYAVPNAGRMAARFLIRNAGSAVAGTIIRGSGAVACRITSAYRVAQPYFLYQQVVGMGDNLAQANAALARGDYETAAALMGRTAGSTPHAWAAARDSFRLLQAVTSLNAQTIGNFLAACFATGTPILGEHGARPIEDYKPGDRVWARDESDPSSLVELKEIEAVFFTQAPIWHIHLGGQVVRTTAEHPFWVNGKGWTATKNLATGDVLVGHDHKETPVGEVFETGVWEMVYNFRVADHHTYFVGRDTWGFDAWAHNDCSVAGLDLAKTRAQAMKDAGVPGAGKLLDLLNRNGGNKSGFVFQTQRAYIYFRRGTLQAVEARVSPLNETRVDMRLTDLQRVEVKSWVNFNASWVSQSQRDGMVGRLNSQVTTYLQTRGSRLRLEFQGSIPDQVRMELQTLKALFGNRLTWRTIH